MKSSHSILSRISGKFTVTAAMILLPLSLAFGTLASEDFDGNGNDNVSLSGLSSGTGWAVGSTYTVAGTPPYYDGGVDLTYFLSGYTNSGSVDGFSGSAFNNGSTAVAGSDYAQRLFTSSTFTTNTTIWMSALVALSSTAASSAAFVMFDDGNARLGVQAGNLVISNGAGTIVSQGSAVLAASKTHLVIFKIVFVASGNDTITGWVDPTNVSSESSLGTAAVSYTANLFGASLSPNVRFGLRGTTTSDYISLDAVRISYGSSSSLTQTMNGP